MTKQALLQSLRRKSRARGAPTQTLAPVPALCHGAWGRAADGLPTPLGKKLVTFQKLATFNSEKRASYLASRFPSSDSTQWPSVKERCPPFFSVFGPHSMTPLNVPAPVVALGHTHRKDKTLTGLEYSQVKRKAGNKVSLPLFAWFPKIQEYLRKKLNSPSASVNTFPPCLPASLHLLLQISCSNIILH